MKILHTADWHIGNFKGPEKDSVNLRGSDILRCLSFIVNRARQESPDLIVVSGDVFNQAKSWADRALPETVEAIRIFRFLGKIAPVCVLKGTPNHDGAGQFQVLSEVFSDRQDHVYIMAKPNVLVVQTQAGPVNVASLPGFDRGVFSAKFPGIAKDEENALFSKELSNIVLALRAMCDKKYPSILLAHYTVQGAQTESGQISIFAQNDPLLTPETLDAANFDLVALGHIHRQQKITSITGKAYYSGSVNALNFNDEGQQKGFYIHALETDEHRFIETPYRPFQTIRLNTEDVDQYNSGYVDEVAQRRWHGKISGKIVRVRYSCTDEAEKEFNKAALERYLTLDGAFFVSGIEADYVTGTVSGDTYQGKASPAENLLAFFEEKGFGAEKVQSLVELAKPMLAEATTAELSKGSGGIFTPVSLEMTNYRSYAHEKFDFSSITFCAVNGPNGAGKSSLFEAINDCLFEEPREGVLTGWIRNASNVHSGSICFTFQLGDKTYRVTRTRTKSGKATLNLAEKIDGNWKSRSKDRLAETQEDIIQTIGMDSQTLRSVAMILQDQYGLFLEANRDTRMDILGIILGIGIYSDLEEIAKREFVNSERIRRSYLDEINVLTDSLADAKKIHSEIDSCDERIMQRKKDAECITASIDQIKLLINIRHEAVGKVKELKEKLRVLSLRQEKTVSDRKQQENIVSQASAILANEPEILKGVRLHRELLEKEKALLAGKVLFDTKSGALASEETELVRLAAASRKLVSEKERLTLQVNPLEEQLSKESELKSRSEQYITAKELLAKMERDSEQYILLSQAISDAEKERSSVDAQFREEDAVRTARLNFLKDKARLLDNVNCLDVAKARCSFLNNAQNAKAKIEPFHTECQKWRASREVEIGVLKSKERTLIEKRNAIGFDASRKEAQRRLVSQLERDAKAYESIPGMKKQRHLIHERMVAIDTEMASLRAQLRTRQENMEKIRNEVERLKESDRQYRETVQKIEYSKKWVEQEKALPVAAEKKRVALIRTDEITKLISDIMSEIDSVDSDLAKEQKCADETALFQEELVKKERALATVHDDILQISMRIGTLNGVLERHEKTRVEIAKRQELITPLAEKITALEQLKAAFSQEGIPHNIVKSILPCLTATASSLLGQMTGGQLSVSFVTEKTLKSNAAKEVVALDILIQELGKEPMLYLSKSGGEKVKSSLSIILALVEITSSRAGIQPGMLFIDEPPFLDEDGIDAYCNALETISRRYRNLKVIAITHDQNMKARFPQSIEIVKDENGSHVLAA